MDDIKEMRDQAVEISELVEDTISHYYNNVRSQTESWVMPLTSPDHLT